MSRHNEAEEPPFDRLDKHARALFISTLLNSGRPIAMVGSGVSIIYGNVSWQRSVVLALEYANAQIDELLKPEMKLPPWQTTRLRKLKAAVMAYSQTDNNDDYPAIKDSGDKYVALDLASEALDIVDEIIKKDPNLQFTSDPLLQNRDPGISRFRGFMAALYRDDSYLVRQTLLERFGLNDPKLPTDGEGMRLKRLIEKLPPDKIQALVTAVYSRSFLDKIVNKSPQLANLRDDVISELNDKVRTGWLLQIDALPTDRRSLLNVFLAELSLFDRWILLLEAYHSVKCSISVKPTYTPHRPLLDPIRALQDWFDIRRYITLNFDYQLEHSLMIDDVRATEAPENGMEWAVAKGLLEPDDPHAPGGGTGGLERRFGDGLKASSDIYSEKAVARLFEFGLNSPDYRAQVLHLHGRADRPLTMLLTDEDNNNQYRRNPTVRTALEQALDVTLTGNPIMFVGIGLTESEITRALRALVSRGYATAANPAFAIMAIDDSDTASWRRQMSFYRQFGIHLIPAGVPDKQGSADLASALETIKQLEKRIGSTIWSPVDKSLEQRAINLWFMKNKNDQKYLWIDTPVFQYIVKDICKSRIEKPDPVKIDRWRDYLARLKEKLYSFVLVEALRSLRDEAMAAHADPMLASAYTNRAKPVRNTFPKAALRVRDQQLWKRTPRLNEVIWRHGTTTLPMGPPKERLKAAAKLKLAKQRQAEAALDLSANIQAKSILRNSSELIFCLDSLGSGRGRLVHSISEQCKIDKRPALIISCSFGIEFDSVLTHLLRFCSKHSAEDSAQSTVLTERLGQTSRLLRAGSKTGRKPPLIVLSGIERLIDSSGRSITAELDLVLQTLFAGMEPVHFNRRQAFQIMIVATPDCRTYLMKQGAPSGQIGQGPTVHWSPAIKPAASASVDKLDGFSRPGLLSHIRRQAAVDCHGCDRRKQLLRAIESTEGLSNAALIPNGPRSPQSKALLQLVLERWHELAFPPAELTVSNRLRADLDRDLLGVLAFIGTPIEQNALKPIAPFDDRVQAIIKADGLTSAESENALAEEIEKSVNRLNRYGLVIIVQRFEDMGASSDMRVALHRSVLSELRNRYGVRSGEEQISNSFSLTLSLSMPTDLVVADNKIRARMKQAVGRLRGSWRDVKLEPALDKAIERLREACLPEKGKAQKGELRFDPEALYKARCVAELERAIRLDRAPMAVNLRAAAGIVRGFFAAASLVSALPDTAPRRDGSLGEFEDHKRRIGKLLERLREAQRAKTEATQQLELLSAEKLVGIEEKDFETIRRAIRAPGTSDDTAALYGSEIVWLLNEQGVIALLQGHLRDAVGLFADARKANGLFRSEEVGTIAWRRLEINEALVLIERGHIVEARSRLTAIAGAVAARARQSTDENELTNPLIENYLGLCAHLGGNYVDAKRHFEKAILESERTGQQRALAVAHLRMATMNFGLRDMAAGQQAIKLGLAAAQTGRQLDITWRALLTQCAGLDRRKDQAQIEAIHRDALHYAEVMDIPRISVQALREQAEHRLALEDLDGASKSAAEAMTQASRHGMVLQRIALRVTMGHILLKKNDRSGRYLLLRAMDHADRIGYQIQIEKADRIMRKYGT